MLLYDYWLVFLYHFLLIQTSNNKSLVIASLKAFFSIYSPFIALSKSLKPWTMKGLRINYSYSCQLLMTWTYESCVKIFITQIAVVFQVYSHDGPWNIPVEIPGIFHSWNGGRKVKSLCFNISFANIRRVEFFRRKRISILDLNVKENSIFIKKY